MSITEHSLLQIFLKKPIIGMVHLRPLPGSPLYDLLSLNMQRITQIAIEEAQKLEAVYRILGRHPNKRKRDLLIGKMEGQNLKPPITQEAVSRD